MEHLAYFNIVAATSENTVVTEYEPVRTRSDSYQSEAALEKEFIRLLCEQGYDYLPIHTEVDLIANLRAKLEELNDYTFSDTEWDRFFADCIANKNDGIVEKTRKIQEDYVQVLKRDDAMSRVGHCIDNCPTEGFWGIVKTEMYQMYEINDEGSLRRAMEDYIRFYNYERLQERFHSQSPMQVRMAALQTDTPEVFPIEENKRIMKYKEHLAELAARA